jgi:hypothetical protein
MTGYPKKRSKSDRAEPLGKNKAPADPENNLSRGAPFDRDERVEQERAEDSREDHKRWERKPEDLDREDAAIANEGIAGEKPGIRPEGDADFVREKG